MGPSTFTYFPRMYRVASRSITAAFLATAVMIFASPVGAATSELSQLAPSCGGGSSDATFSGNNRRLALTAQRRELAVFDPHGSGVQLMWRDDGAAGWSKQTQGAVSDGQLLGPDIPNDRTASVVVDEAGTTGWVIWAGYAFSMISEVRMRRLTNLDDASGPTVGPEVTLRPGGMGNVRVDAIFHEGSVWVSWTERTGDTAYALKAARLSSLSTDSPALTDVATLWQGTPQVATGTLVSTSSGLRVAARTQKLRIHSHISGTTWMQGSGAVGLNGKARPSAVALASGVILVAAQSDPKAHVVKVFHFTNNGNGTPGVEVNTGPGYAQPTIVRTAGDAAVVVMVNKTADSLVSRARTGGAWSESEITELTAESGGNYAWPNALREPGDGVLRLLVDGKPCPKSKKQQEVLHYRRPL